MRWNAALLAGLTLLALGLVASLAWGRQISTAVRMVGAYRAARNFQASYPHLDRDVAFDPDMDPRLDVYWPATGEGHPVLFFVHGGSWKDYDKNLFAPVAMKLVPEGMVVVIPDYTLYPDARYEQMAGEVAHELNTPLANILGYAQLAQSQSVDPAVRESLDTIVTQARRAGQILGDMLTVARAPALTNQGVDLAELARAFSRLVAPLARRQGVQIAIVQSDEAPAWADASRVEQILFNLVTNATQAGAHRIELVPGAGVLDIVDDGSGVALDMRSRLFEPFATSKPHGQGTGLGLAICRRLAEEMGGTLELAESAPGRTRFQLTLPTSP